MKNPLSRFNPNNFLEWDLEDRDARIESGELTMPETDPTIEIVGEDE